MVTIVLTEAFCPKVSWVCTLSSSPQPRHAPDGRWGLLALPRGPGPSTQVHMCTHVHTRTPAQEGQPCWPLLGGGPPARWPAHPGAFRPLPPSARLPGILLWACPSRHFLSWACRLTSIPPSLQMAGTGTACPQRRRCHAWPGPRVQPARQGAFLPLLGAWHPLPTLVALGWGRRAHHTGAGEHPQGGPQGNNEGDRPLADRSPPNTSPPRETADALGRSGHLCACAHVLRAHTAVRRHITHVQLPRGHERWL